jgi:hypothetical protein
MGGLAIQYPKISEKKVNSPLIIQRRKSSQHIKTPVDRILFLQRTIGNQAVQRLIKSGTLQAKLKIGQPGDKYEQKADRVAKQVMRMPELGVQRQVEPEEEEQVQTKPVTEQITPLVQRQVEEEEEEELRRQPIEEEEEELQTKTTTGSIPEVQPDIESHIHSLKGGGWPLLANDRAFFEPRFGRDFSQVRMHTDTRAAESARAVNARAFTVGQDVVFGTGQYVPGASGGRRLMAHELTHVVQQSKSHNGQSLNNIIQKAKGNTCTPSAGIPNINCAVYAANSWWLPRAYVQNATCACQRTPNVATANCVRKFLQDRLATTPRWLKIMAASQKFLENSLTYFLYQTFVQKFLTPRIYRDHVAAYHSCCCPSGPAPYPAWIGVTSVPMPCFVVGWSIRQFGSCHGTPGRW